MQAPFFINKCISELSCNRRNNKDNVNNQGGTSMSDTKKKEWLSWLKIFVIALIFALIVRKFFFSPIIVDGPSMQPTLYSQDQMIVNKAAYIFNQPERFDIVVFHASEQKDFIKRVIGLPGEHVMVEDNILYINGEQVEQPFLEQVDNSQLIPNITGDFTLEQLTGAYQTIPDGYILVLGDNRNNSTDSRHELGLVSLEQVVGKTKVIYWPPNRMQFISE